MLIQDDSHCSSAALHCWPHGVRSRSLGTWYLYQGGDLDFLQGVRLREQTGKKLGDYAGGKTAKTNRAQAWTSYRGEGWENIQDRGLDIKQGVEL